MREMRQDAPDGRHGADAGALVQEYDGHGITLSDDEFVLFQKLLYDLSGISLAPAKKPLVSGRLEKRLKHHGLGSYRDYFRLVTGNDGKMELQIALDLLTTNETYFFREPKHFEFLRTRVLPAAKGGRPFRVWSAASSSGEEAYSIAMTLADVLQDRPWEVLGTDISSRVLEKARSGHYVMERAKHIPPGYLSRYCLKGVCSQEGTFLVDKKLRGRVQFMQMNLNAPLPRMAEFDVIFLRNVLIYFDVETKRRVVGRLLSLLKRGGYFMVGHSESLNGIADSLEPLMPAIYRKA